VEVPLRRESHRLTHRQDTQMGRDDGHAQPGHPSFVGKLLEQDDVDAPREGVPVLARAVMDTEVSSQIEA